MVTSLQNHDKRKNNSLFLPLFSHIMTSIRQDYSPIDSLQKMVDDIPSGSDKKKHKKHKKDKKERIEMAPQATQQQQPQQLQLQTTPAFAPNELLTEMGFDVSPSTPSSHSWGPPTAITVMDEKKYDLNNCLFHNCNLEFFQAKSNIEWFVNALSPMNVDCSCIGTKKKCYIGVLNRKFHNVHRKLKWEVRCECNNQTTLKVSKSAFNPGRPFFACRGCRFFQWADAGFTKKNEQLQKNLKEYGRF